MVAEIIISEKDKDTRDAETRFLSACFDIKPRNILKSVYSAIMEMKEKLNGCPFSFLDENCFSVIVWHNGKEHQVDSQIVLKDEADIAASLLTISFLEDEKYKRENRVPVCYLIMEPKDSFSDFTKIAGSLVTTIKRAVILYLSKSGYGEDEIDEITEDMDFATCSFADKFFSKIENP